MELFINLLLNGLVSGSEYALMAMGMALIFGATRHFHIAHAAVFAAAGYMTFLLIDWYLLPPSLAASVALVLTVALGLCIALFVYEPLNRRGGEGFKLFLVSLGLMIAIDNIFTIGLGARPARPLLGEWFRSSQGIGPWSITGGQLALICVAVGSCILLMVVLRKTQIGRLIRAYSENRDYFEIYGLKPKVVIALVYSVASLLAGIAGIYLAADTGMSPGRGEHYFIVAIMAVFIGGIGSVSGAFIIAMSLGVLENMLLYFMGSEWTLAAVFLLFLVFITLYPTGLSSVTRPSRKPKTIRNSAGAKDERKLEGLRL